MSEDISQKTKKSLLWNIVDKVGMQLLSLVLSMYIARMLCPSDFGMIGALTIFSTLGTILVDSGFGMALLRREAINREEYSAVFYTNILISLGIYIPLYFCAPLIARLYNIPELERLSRFLFVILLVSPWGIIQTAQLKRAFKFKYLTISNLAATLTAGITAIVLIKYGYGYWALAWQLVLVAGLRNLFMWIFNPYKLSLHPDFSVVKKLWSFSLFVMLTSAITNIVANAYNLVIGKFFSVTDLGFYAQAKKYQDIPSNYVVANAICGVAAPALAKLNNDIPMQKEYLQKFVRITAFAIFPIMILLDVGMEDFVTLVLTEKWTPLVPYFTILSIGGMAYPFQMVYQHYILMKGQKKPVFYLEGAKNILIILSIILCIFIIHSDITYLVWSSTFVNLISMLAYMLMVKKIGYYGLKEQIKDMVPYFMMAVIAGVGMALSRLYISGLFLRICIELLVGGSIYIGVGYFSGAKVINEIKNMKTSPKTIKQGKE